MPDKPYMVYWRLRHVLLTSILGPKELVDNVLATDHDGGTAGRVVVRQYVPHGATAWATSDKGPWQPLNTLPQEWGLAPKEEPHEQGYR